FSYNLRKHVFELDVETKEPKQVTKGEFDVTKATWSRRSPDRLRRANGRPAPIPSGPLRPRRRLPEGEAADEAQYGNRIGRLVSGRPANRVPRERAPARLRLPRPPVVDQGIWDGCTQTPRFSGSKPFE